MSLSELDQTRKKLAHTRMALQDLVDILENVGSVQFMTHE
jgi:hypothetical protein